MSLCTIGSQISVSLPGPTGLRFSAISFTAAMLYWNASSDDSVCINNYTILIQSRAEQVIYNTTTDPATTFLEVAGLTRGVEYTVIVTAHSSGDIKASKLIRMTLDGMKQQSR